MSWLGPETGDFVPRPRYRLFGSLIKKRIIGCCDLKCHSTFCEVGLTTMPQNCVSMLCTHACMLCLFIHCLQTAPILRIPRLAKPSAILASSVLALVYFRESAWSMRLGLLAVFTLVCSCHFHGGSAREALLLLIHDACGSYIAIAYPPSYIWGLVAIVYRLHALHAGFSLAIAKPNLHTGPPPYMV